MTQKICDTRSGVTKVKSLIDGMRTTRDTQMSDMTQLKAKIKEQNQRLIQLSQEKAKLDAKTKVNDSADQEQVQAAFSNKQVHPRPSNEYYHLNFSFGSDHNQATQR